MDFSYGHVRELYARHPAWQLLRTHHAPLIISFLQRTYIDHNRRLIPADEFLTLLEDELYALRQRDGADAFPKEAKSYLSDWLKEGFLRRTWTSATDQDQIDLTPQTEKAIQWAMSLREKTFVGTESRLLTFVDLVRQMAEKSNPDVDKRLNILNKQRAELDAKIDRVRLGEVEVLSASELRDRFQQIDQIARELLADFREVEDNFRKLSRTARERIALWDGSKGLLLDEVLRSRDEIRDSDQGRSFEAFCRFLLSVANREELGSLMSTALELPAIREQVRHTKLDRVTFDWISAGEATQQTIASLSQQLRRFLDDRALNENRRIMEILRAIEVHALALRYRPPEGAVAWLDEMKCTIELPMDRPLYRPTAKLSLVDTNLEEGQAARDPDALYSQTVVDRTALAHHIASVLVEHGTVSLRDLTEIQPLSQGLAEVITYLDLGTARFHMEPFDFLTDKVMWQSVREQDEIERSATMPRILFKERTRE